MLGFVTGVGGGCWVLMRMKVVEGKVAGLEEFGKERNSEAGSSTKGSRVENLACQASTLRRKHQKKV